MGDRQTTQPKNSGYISTIIIFLRNIRQHIFYYKKSSLYHAPIE
jgi:hypothetical protein